MRLSGGRRFALALLAAVGARAAERVEVVWPTPNPAWSEGRSISDFLQHAGSGDPESGGFGGVRSGGAQFHEGLDMKCISRDRRGEPTDSVVAAMDGVVQFAGRSAGYGNFVKLASAGGIGTGYGHMSRIAVRYGQRVSQGEVIGYVGSTGMSTGPHLHWEVWKNGISVNPRNMSFSSVSQLSGDALRQFKAKVAWLLSIKPGAH